MAIRTYNYDSIPTEQEFNAFLRPKFDREEEEEEFPGSLHRLGDDSLSNKPTQLKKRYETFETELQVSAGTGLFVTYKGGKILLPNGTQASIAPGTIAIADNATNYIYLDDGGIVRSTQSLPFRRFLLAEVLTSGGAIASIVDSRMRGYEVHPPWRGVKVFGGSGEEGDYNLTGAAVLDRGEYFHRNLTIAATGALSVPSAIALYVAGDCVINGTVTVLTASRGGALAATTQVEFIGGLPGSGPGAGNRDSPGSIYNYLIAPYGSGGAGGFVDSQSTGFQITSAAGGDGGGYFLIECAGKVTIGSGAIISCKGADGGFGSYQVGAQGHLSGGGAGSGGLIVIRASEIVVASGGTLDVRGGRGGDAIGANAHGGGGGGGGQIILIAPPGKINTTGANLLLAGGANGTSGSGAFIGGGGGGSFGGVGGAKSGASIVPSGIGKLILGAFLAVA